MPIASASPPFVIVVTFLVVSLYPMPILPGCIETVMYLSCVNTVDLRLRAGHGVGWCGWTSVWDMWETGVETAVGCGCAGIATFEQATCAKGDDNAACVGGASNGCAGCNGLESGRGSFNRPAAITAAEEASRNGPTSSGVNTVELRLCAGHAAGW